MVRGQALPGRGKAQCDARVCARASGAAMPRRLATLPRGGYGQRAGARHARGRKEANGDVAEERLAAAPSCRGGDEVLRAR